MSAKLKKRRVLPAQPAPSGSAPNRRGWLFPFTLGSIVAGVIVFVATYRAVTEENTRVRKELAAKTAEADYPSLGELAAMTGEELSRQDIALLNLRCAEGLPGAESLKIQKCLQTLDEWAAWVKHETDRHLYKFQQNPKDYENSEAYFRMLMLITVLQQDLKVHYNPDRIRDVDFTKSQDLFIHGMIGNDNGGTCVSMPVLYTAIARRLGYPVYLVTAKAHVFCRWHDAKDYVNVEATSQGLNSYKDDYYMKWPKPISEAEVKAGYYLRSLPPAEEFAVFLSARGHCLEDTGKTAEAVVSYAQALCLTPKSPDYFAFLINSMGFRPRSALPPIARRHPVEPSAVYQAFSDPYPPQDPYAHSRPNSNSGMGWAQPSAVAQPYNVYKPYVPSTSVPSGFPNPVADPAFGFQP